MHPALELSNLSKLPYPIRAQARAAATGSTEQQLRFVSRRCHIFRQLSLEQQPFLLPLFHAVLDPTQIDLILTELDTSSLDSEKTGEVHYPRILAVLFSLSAVAALLQNDTVPLAALPDLWARLWPWMDFLDTYESIFCIPAPALESFESRYLTYVAILREFRRSNDIMIPWFMCKMLGDVCFVIGKAWRYLIYCRDEAFTLEHRTALRRIAECLRLYIFDDINQKNTLKKVDQLAFGAGGMRKDLAFLMVSHLEYFLDFAAQPDPHCQDDTSRSVFSVMTYVCVTAGLFNNKWEDDALQRALFECGLVPVVVKILRALNERSLHANDYQLEGLANFVGASLSYPPCNACTALYLDAGLLPAIFASSNLPHMKTAQKTFASIIRYAVGPLATVYHSVLLYCRIEFPKIAALEANTLFPDEPSIEEWTGIKTHLEDRLRILHDYESGALDVPLACNNIKCGSREYSNNEMRRCGGCSLLHYCSKQCQMDDWAAGHRLTCSVLASRRYRYLAARDRSFLRALIYAEYTKVREDLATEDVQQSILERSGPNNMPYILFDLATSGGFQTKIAPLELLPSGFSHEEARILASIGRVEFQLVR
ncbi:hypothetical protein R3P38DRAFT_3576663, partial [Favolaschia claudopus]